MAGANLGELERAVMDLLWDGGEPLLVREVANALANRGLAYTTVMTLLGRLAAKGAVVVDREREPFVYKPAFARASILKDRLREFLDDVFDGEAQAMVLGLVEDESLTLDELKDIEQRINHQAGKKERRK